MSAGGNAAFFIDIDKKVNLWRVTLVFTLRSRLDLDGMQGSERTSYVPHFARLGCIR